ncbi:MAG TPA: hypothetical protein VLA88_05560 [Candidatus Saccharimonadales bacterium]|nr:hypothetical protein [Candidatus Saccharimonadales bacterium]
MSIKTIKLLLTVALLVLYSLLLWQILYSEDLGIKADAEGLNGATIGIFGKWWPVPLLINALAIVALHIIWYKKLSKPQ